MKIITDSSCDLTPELSARLGVDHIIPMKITADGNEYIDRVTLSLDDFYYHILPGCKQLPKTSQITVNEFMEIYAAYPDEELLVLPLSSGLSGEYNSACLAAQESGRDNIYVVDNKSTTLALALMAEIACRMRNEGYCAADIQQKLEALSPRVRVYALLETLHYLVMGGRLSKVAGAVGNALRIMPIICLKNGTLTSVGKAHGIKGGLRTLRTYIDRDPIDTDYPIYFAHTNNEDGIEQLRATFAEAPHDAPALLVGPVVGTHVGPGATAISYIAKE